MARLIAKIPDFGERKIRKKKSLLDLRPHRRVVLNYRCERGKSTHDPLLRPQKNKIKINDQLYAAQFKHSYVLYEWKTHSVTDTDLL